MEIKKHAHLLLVVGLLSTLISVSLGIISYFFLVGFVFSVAILIYLLVKKIDSSGRAWLFFLFLSLFWVLVWLILFFIYVDSFIKFIFLPLFLVTGLMFGLLSLYILPGLTQKFKFISIIIFYSLITGIILTVLYSDFPVGGSPALEAFLTPAFFPVLLWQVGMATILGWALDRQEGANSLANYN